jgi:hypothetical protein
MPHDATILALEQQVACYKQLAKLAELQHEHVRQSQTEALLEVLGLRQAVLEDASRLEATIAPAKRRWTDYVASLCAADRAKAEGLLAQTRQLLEQITTADRNDAMVLQQRKLNLGRQIAQTTTARQINRSYATAAYGATVPKMDVKQ